MPDAFSRMANIVGADCPNCGDTIVYELWLCPDCGGRGYFHPRNAPVGVPTLRAMVAVARMGIIQCERCKGSKEIVTGVCCPSCEIEFLDCDIDEVPSNHPRLEH